MTRTLLLTVLFLSSGLMFASQAVPAASELFEPQPAGADPQNPNAREEDLYSSATEALNDARYGQAVDRFGQVATIHGRRADAALYWKAYALNKAANKMEALSTIDALKKSYPQSRWLRQASALALEIRAASGQQVNPETVSDEELKLYAVNSLMQTAPDKAIPILEKVLQGNSSFNVKDKALFVLSQSKSDKAQQIILAIAKGGNQPELQMHAIKWLAISGGKGNSQALQEIYASASSPEVKRAALKSFIISGDKDVVFKIAQQEKSPDLRRDAIKQLGIMGARAELRQIYKETRDSETKEALLQAMGISGDVQTLIEIAKTETDRDVQSLAIKSLGIFGRQAGSDTLVGIYSSSADLGIKKQVIRALFIQGDAKEMVAMARKETNPELKKELVRNLSIMHSTEATDYMMEILNK
ncbi:MAG TPA: HEAT repeat domain-containing protein [Candidatus Angelobacter sp.]|nr:HEAT repeat domain-containing protein [Candidatus Angelobacter sp.]